jgi:hypothetical protein
MNLIYSLHPSAGQLATPLTPPTPHHITAFIFYGSSGPSLQESRSRRVPHRCGQLLAFNWPCGETHQGGEAGEIRGVAEIHRKVSLCAVLLVESYSSALNTRVRLTVFCFVLSATMRT